ncbi:MAG TPA: hypothetical protein VFM87_06255 [Agrococcus sp.]|nr:hypothetical protein [Agrococcus sp.]
MRRLALRAAAVIAATLVLAGCAAAEETPPELQGPNGYTAAADLGDGFHLWWDRSPESGKSDLIATDPDGRIVGSCLGMPGEICFIGPQDGRMGLVIADPAAERGVIHFYGQDVELTPGTGPGEEDPAVFAVRLPQERPDEDAGWSIELFDASGQPVPLQ